MSAISASGMPGVVVQDEDRALLRREPFERAIEGIPVDDRDHRIRPARSVDRQDRDPRAPAAVAAQLLVTGIDEQPMQPWSEPFRIPQPWEIAPGEEECLLDGVLRPFRIAKDPIRDGVAQVTVEVDQLREGDVVAVTGLFDQPRPHVAVLQRRPIRTLHPNRWSQARERFTRAPVRAGTGPRTAPPRTTEAFPRDARHAARSGHGSPGSPARVVGRPARAGGQPRHAGRGRGRDGLGP